MTMLDGRGVGRDEIYCQKKLVFSLKAYIKKITDEKDMSCSVLYVSVSIQYKNDYLKIWTPKRQKLMFGEKQIKM